jgi:outer membrane protein assembly factor BamD (BamD/ComL family)
MKRCVWLLSGLIVVTLLSAGCGKKSGVDTGKLESSFQSAEPANKSGADKAVTAIKAGNYPQALTELQQLAKKAKLTPEQQQAIKDVIAQVQKQVSEMANKAAGDAQKTASDLQKSLPK